MNMTRMSHHDALTRALDLLHAAYPNATDPDDTSDTERVLCLMGELEAMFAPHKGDPEFKNRVPHPCKCSNCDHTFTRMFLPADVDRVATMTQRGAFCPRCYATEGILVAWGGDAGLTAPPMSFSATVSDVAMDLSAGGKSGRLQMVVSARSSRENLERAREAIAAGELVCLTTMPGSKKP
jgi:hypothetical protein